MGLCMCDEHVHCVFVLMCIFFGISSMCSLSMLSLFVLFNPLFLARAIPPQVLFVPFVLVMGTFYRSKPWWNAVWFKPAKGGINRFPNPSQKEICFQFSLMCVDGLLFVPFVLVVGTVYRSFPWWRAVHFKPAKGGINRFPNPTQKKIAQGFVLICLDVCVLPFMLFVFGTAYRFPAVWEARADSKKSEQLRLELRDAHRKNCGWCSAEFRSPSLTK